MTDTSPQHGADMGHPRNTSPHRTLDLSTAYTSRWYFAEIHQGILTPDRDTFERFLELEQSDVDWVAASTRTHRLGQTWAGLARLLGRDEHAFVRDIGLPAARSWAVHLELTTETLHGSGRT
jgi:hypothetical protein